jgi:hypothetical protein
MTEKDFHETVEQIVQDVVTRVQVEQAMNGKDETMADLEKNGPKGPWKTTFPWLQEKNVGMPSSADLEQMSTEEVSTMKDMIQWWEENQGRPKLTEVRPEFDRSETAVKTLRISKTLCEAAEEKAAKDRALTRGSFSGLVEYLLWSYLDRDEKFLRKEQPNDEGEDPRDDHLIFPPQPRTHKGSRKHLVERLKLQGTCDASLHEIFEKERQARGLNVSQMLDLVLYNLFGKPKLSFEKESSQVRNPVRELSPAHVRS